MSGLIFEDQAVEAGCLQGSQGIVFCSVGCLSGQTMTKIKLVDCRESFQHWSAVAIDVSPSLLVAEVVRNLESGRLSSVVQMVESSKTNMAEVEFKCGQGYNYHGHTYATVEIGRRCWFAENLQTTTYLTGDTIPEGLNQAEWENSTIGALAFAHCKSLVSIDLPTSLVSVCPSACTANIRHDRAVRPFSRIVQAPHTPCSQPTWVPVSRHS